MKWLPVTLKCDVDQTERDRILNIRAMEFVLVSCFIADFDSSERLVRSALESSCEMIKKRRAMMKIRSLIVGLYAVRFSQSPHPTSRTQLPHYAPSSGMLGHAPCR